MSTCPNEGTYLVFARARRVYYMRAQACAAHIFELVFEGSTFRLPRPLVLVGMIRMDTSSQKTGPKAGPEQS